MPSDADLLKVTSSAIIEIASYAEILQSKFGDFLEPEVPGVYVAGEIFPRIIPGREYFTKVKVIGHSEALVKINAFENITTAILDENARLVIPKYMVLDKDRYLSNTPTVPARFYILIGLLIQNHLDMLSPITSRRADSRKIINLIKENYEDIYESGDLSIACRYILDQVDSFVGNDVWYMYFSKFVGKDVIIEKTCDYRVYQWEREHGDEYRGIIKQSTDE
jgi:hypothetical protein